MVSNKIYNEKIFISKRINENTIHDFFKSIMVSFKDDLQRLTDNWFNEKTNSNSNDVFSLIERSFVGLLSNTVERCFPNISALQEYSVKLGNKKYGRCDYAIKHNGINIIFEAKQRQFEGKEYSKSKIEAFFKPFTKKLYHITKHNHIYILGKLMFHP